MDLLKARLRKSPIKYLVWLCHGTYQRSWSRRSFCRPLLFPGGGRGGAIRWKERECSSEIQKKEKKKNLIRTKILFCTCGLTFFPPLRGGNSKITTQLLSYQNSSFQKVRCRPAFYIAAPQALTSDKALLHNTRFYFVPMYMLFEGDCSIFSYRN